MFFCHSIFNFFSFSAQILLLKFVFLKFLPLSFFTQNLTFSFSAQILLLKFVFLKFLLLSFLAHIFTLQFFAQILNAIRPGFVLFYFRVKNILIRIIALFCLIKNLACQSHFYELYPGLK